MAIEKELLDQLLAGRDPNEVFAKDGLLDDLKKALSERILNAELDEHLDGERVEGSANRRNGHSKKSVSDRNVEDDAVDPARLSGDVRSEADREVSATIPRLRRQDY